MWTPVSSGRLLEFNNEIGFSACFRLVRMTAFICSAVWHFFTRLSMWNNWIAASCPWPACPGPVKGTPPINHCGFKKCVLGDLKRRVETGEGEKPCMQDASPKSDIGFLYFTVHGNTSQCNSISICLLPFQSCWKQHFGCEDEGCPFSCVLYLTTPAPLCLPAYTPHFIQMGNLSERKRGKRTARAFFLCFLRNKSWGGSLFIRLDTICSCPSIHPGILTTHSCFALNRHYFETELRRPVLSAAMQRGPPSDTWQDPDLRDRSRYC